MDWRHAYVGSKNVTKAPDREVYRLREFIKTQFLVQVVSHQLQYLLYSLVHTKAPVNVTRLLNSEAEPLMLGFLENTRAVSFGG